MGIVGTRDSTEGERMRTSPCRDRKVTELSGKPLERDRFTDGSSQYFAGLVITAPLLRISSARSTARPPEFTRTLSAAGQNRKVPLPSFPALTWAPSSRRSANL